jgi:hypothetical protein
LFFFRSGSVVAEIGIEMTGVETDTKAEVDRVLSDIVQSEKVLSSYVLLVLWFPPPIKLTTTI